MKNHGFTLIEALLVVSIAGLLLAAGLPAVADLTANNRIRSVAEQVRDGLNQARLEAIRRNTTIQFVPNGTGWSVVQPAVGQTPAVTIARRDPYAAETAITASPTGDLVAFNGSGRMTSGSSYTVRLTPASGTCVASGGTARCLNVVAARGGQVRMCDPAQDSSKPEGC